MGHPGGATKRIQESCCCCGRRRQVLSSPRRKGTMQASSRSCSSDGDGAGGKASRRRGKGSANQRSARGKHRRKQEDGEAAAEAGVRGSVPRRHKATCEGKSDLEMSSSITGASGPSSGKRGTSTSKMLSKLMPFQSVLEVVKQHSGSSTNLPDRLSSVFDDIVRPCSDSWSIQ